MKSTEMRGYSNALARLCCNATGNYLPKSFSVIRSVHASCALLRESPKNLRGKKHSSQLWLVRQIRDPYVELARQENYRCRSAFKLLEMNERFKFLAPGLTIVDCGAAPGSWTQVAAKLTNATGKTDGPVGTVLAIDKQPIYPIEGATVLGSMDFTTSQAQEAVSKLLEDRKVDAVLSDMAPNASGIREIDHDNIIKLAYVAFKFAIHVLRAEGTFLTKVWDGGRSQNLEQDLKKFFKTVKTVKPQATRDESTEIFFLARGFKGLKSTPT